MMKLRKAASGFLAAAIFASMLAGCSGDGNQESSTASTGSSTQSSSASTSSDGGSTEAGGLPIVDEPITLRVLSENRADITLGNDMPVFQELEKRTNIHLEWELLPIDGGEKTTKFNVIMASGDIPDLVHHTDANNVNRYGMQGLFLPLQDLINEYAPNIVETFNNPLEGDEIPYDIDVWGSITAADGNIYTVPIISASNAIGAVWGIRTDWLDTLGLEIPETTDELYEVLKAFKEQDPNGNGEADEIPWVSGNGGKTGTITPIVSAFDAHMDLYVDPETDTIKYGPVEENYKEALIYLNKLYSEGLIESDYLTATSDQWLARAGGNQAGFMFVWPGSGFAASNNELQKLDEGYHFEPIKPFKSPSGKQTKDTYVSGAAVQYRTSVSANTEYPEEIMRYLDYCFSDEGFLLANFGIEGDDYTMVDGEPQYTEKILANPEGVDPETIRIRQGIRWQLLPYENGWADNYQAMEQSAPWTVAAWDTYKGKGLVEAPMPTLPLSESQLTTRAALLAEINTFKDPYIDRFIMGESPIEEFDEFVAGIERSGLEELLTMLNEAYDLYKANAQQ